MEYTERKRWGFLGLPWTFTVYHVKEDILTTDKGLLNRIEDDCYMYKIQDVKLHRSIWERMFGTGTVVCYTGDVTDQRLELKHIRRSKEIKDFILEKSEESRMKRRTMNMQNIGVNPAVDVDDDGLLDLI